MSREYDLYLQQHKTNVKKCYEWIRENLPDLIPNDIRLDLAHQISFAHDSSKTEQDEYDAYNKYFYGGNRSYQVVQDFNYAWLNHIHRNPHHWQHWVLLCDEPDEGEIIMEMPYNYILEMICDWWAFSWNNDNLYEIFKWYDEHKEHIKLGDKTRKTVEDILDMIHNKLDENNELAHHGVMGQRKGVRNGPPYPLNRNSDGSIVKKKTVEVKSINIPEEKLTKYALSYSGDANKARVFESALGYTIENYKHLIENINRHFDPEKLEERGDNGFGMRYQQIMNLKGPNGNRADVLTAWINQDNTGDFKLITTYVYTKGKEKKQNDN